MKLSSRLSFFTALFMTVAIAAIVFMFDYVQKNFKNGALDVDLLFVVSILLIFIICFFGIDSLFNYYGKQQVQRMAENLPEQIFEDQSNIGFR